MEAVRGLYLVQQSSETPMPRKAKGKRPSFFKDPDIDKVMGILMALAGEVSVLRERIDTVERLAMGKGLVSKEEIDAFVPDQEVANQRELWREAYIERILRVVQQELEATDKGETSEAYQKAVKDVSS